TQITVFDVDIRDPWTVAPYNGVNPFPHPPVGDDNGLKKIPGLPRSGARGFDLHFRTPDNPQGDLSIQGEVFRNVLVTVAYVGLKGTKLYQSINQNPSAYIPGQSTTSNTQQRRLYPWIGRIEQERTDAYSRYHSLQLSFEKRLSRGLTFL